MSVIREALAIYRANWDDFHDVGPFETTLDDVEEAIEKQAMYEAAPDLLGALKAMVAKFDPDSFPGNNQPEMDAALDAIAKAEMKA